MASRTCDVVAIGGDLDDPCAGVRHLGLNYAMHKLRPNVVRDGIFRFAKGQAKPVVVVLGNHDNPDPRSLHGAAIDAGSIRVGGVGGSLPTSDPFPFQLEESEYESLLGRMGRVDVLVVHQPPHGTRCDVAYSGEHAGSRAVRAYIEREKPSLVLTGHIHESAAVDRLGGTTILNPGPFFAGNWGEAELSSEGVTARILDVSTNAQRSEAEARASVAWS